jgi:hypothetical protein
MARCGDGGRIADYMWQFNDIVDVYIAVAQ